MFRHLFFFEVRYWLRQPMVYVFLLITTLLFTWSAASDDLTIGGTFGNIYKNAPFVIQNQFLTWVLLSLLITTAFVQSAALRDFSYKTEQIIFASPIRKVDYLMGRFCGAYVVALIPYLGISLGILLGTLIGQTTGSTDPDRYGPLVWSAHLNSFLVFALPNTFITASIIFTIAALTRSTITSFVGAILLLVAYLVANNFLNDVENEQLAYYVDTFGARPFELITKYWTVSEKNTLSVSLANPMLLLNRLIWIGFGAGLLVFTYSRFSFTEKATSRRAFRLPFAGRRKTTTESIPDTATPIFTTLEALPHATQQSGASTHWAQLFRMAKTDFRGIVTGTAFLCIMLAGVLNMGFSLKFANSGYGLSSYPVTYDLISTIRGTMYLFLIAIIVFYSGALIWKERDANIDQLHDAMPHPTWTVFVAKLLAMIGTVAVILLLCVVAGVITQTAKGYTNYELGLYLTEFFAIDLLRFIPLIILSMLVHTLVNNKYLAFFIFVALLMMNAYIWTPLDVASNLVQFNASPSYRYSDMNGFGPYVTSFVWFRAYWTLFAALLGAVAVLFWVRGKDTGLKDRIRLARRSYAGNRLVLPGLLLALIGVGGYIYYNTKVVNTYQSAKVQERAQVAYEKKFKKYQHRVQPRIVDVKYAIDVYPDQRNLVVNGDWVVKNKATVPIDSVHIILPQRPMTCAVTLDPTHPKRATLLLNDDTTQYRIYRLSPALAPGDSMRIHFVTKKITRGFENEVTGTKQINQNGTFFDNGDVDPQIGYQEQGELTGKNDRKDYGLPERERMPKLARNCTDCANTYLSNNSDWVNVETVISTAPDQIAVAPGSLLKEWTKTETGQDGQVQRRYFHYKLDHKSMNFYSFISARFEVARQKWNGIDIEVYHDKKHPYNVANMLQSVKSSLAYYTANFGPYYHKQARIIEFPRYASFAQAFPGTMPYSEAIGFIDKIDPETDVDMVKYVVAHEMGHQWWAHQVVGAQMEGATLLSETQAQYSALMVMEKTYGKARMKRFLKYEVDNYLSSRGSESLKEQPLERVDANQGYVHYRKGSAVMYYLKEMIGEKAVNAALRSLAGDYAYREPPYPTAYALVDRFRQNTPDSLNYLITDLFETMTIFNNRTTKASYSKLPNGQYRVTVNVESEKFRADSLGRETPVKLDDWIDVGVYGKPAEGKKQGVLLTNRREHFRRKTGTYSFVVKDEPYEAGIDPISYLIDRIPDDNLKKVTKL